MAMSMKYKTLFLVRRLVAISKLYLLHSGVCLDVIQVIRKKCLSCIPVTRVSENTKKSSTETNAADSCAPF